MWAIMAERRKHIMFREVWVSCFICVLYLLVILFQDLQDIDLIQRSPANQNWYSVQQDIYSYGATLTAFILAVSLPRLICCEHEYHTEFLVKTSEKGSFLTWKSKVFFSILYSATVVFVIGAVSLFVHCGMFGFDGALHPVEACVYFSDEYLPQMSNLLYCILQYVFLLMGALYFAGFVLLIASLTKRTAFTIFLSGALYLLCMVYRYVETLFRGVVNQIVGGFFYFGFGGFLLQESYSWPWKRGWPGNWTVVWKPIMLVVTMTILEFSVLWLVWKKRDRK